MTNLIIKIKFLIVVSLSKKSLPFSQSYDSHAKGIAWSLPFPAKRSFMQSKNGSHEWVPYPSSKNSETPGLNVTESLQNVPWGFPIESRALRAFNLAINRNQSSPRGESKSKALSLDSLSRIGLPLFFSEPLSPRDWTQLAMLVKSGDFWHVARSCENLRTLCRLWYFKNLAIFNNEYFYYEHLLLFFWRLLGVRSEVSVRGICMQILWVYSDLPNLF